ncbi:MAG: carboxymuconolactone decarboxylase family protein [Firmicutes bacterium]|nr:carboxymuconolactone decarboxylase family protein [Bacillota bacterium]
MKDIVLNEIGTMYENLKKNGNLDLKTISLLELAVNLALNDKDKFIKHLINAKQNGATTDELNDVIALVSLIMGRKPLETVLDSGKVEKAKCC